MSLAPQPMEGFSQFGLKAFTYNVDLISGSPVTILTGISNLNAIPYAVFLVNANLGGTIHPTAMTYTLDGNSQPIVTATFSSSVTRTCVVAVVYKQ